MPKLQTLDLSSNEISYIEADSFSNSLQLRQVDIQGSRLNCSCDQIAFILSSNVQRIIGTCVANTERAIINKNFGTKTYPSFVSNVPSSWSQWLSLPSYDIDLRTNDCGRGFDLRKGKCVSCKEGHRPNCVERPLSLDQGHYCVSFHTRMGYGVDGRYCRLQGCPLASNTSATSFFDSSPYEIMAQKSCNRPSHLKYILLGVVFSVTVLFSVMICFRRLRSCSCLC